MSDDIFFKLKNQINIKKNNKSNIFSNDDIDSEEYPDINEKESNLNIEEEVDEENKNDSSTLKVMDSNNNIFQHIFFPKADISAYELARILSFTQLMITDDIYSQIPGELKKHFTKISD